MARSRARTQPRAVVLADLLLAAAQSRGEPALSPIDGWPAPNGSRRCTAVLAAAARFAARHWADGPRAIDATSWVWLPSSPDALFAVADGTQAYAVTVVAHRFPDPDMVLIYRLGPLEEFIAPGRGTDAGGQSCGTLVWHGDRGRRPSDCKIGERRSPGRKQREVT